MTYFQALILGFVQGITEFLPVSSSGHLVVAQHLLDMSTVPLLFDVIFHTGTLIAVIIFFFSELKRIKLHDLPLYFIATLPAAIFGLILEPVFEIHFKQLWVVSIGFIVTAILLLSTKIIPHSVSLKKITLKQAFIIGLAQAVAIIPGISRSGSTVSTGLNLNLSPEKSFSFSFILSIPAILGALILELPDLTSLTSTTNLTSLTLGFLSATITGLVSLILLKKIVVSSKLHYFGYYCLLLAALTIFTN